ncbi:hypothetical protein DFS33DRAFT_279436 [Desarmillaria ectypa]|nr:hypothetical protein DFS33DRAFT_279436 [Desarmillaria ectypa]
MSWSLGFLSTFLMYRTRSGCSFAESEPFSVTSRMGTPSPESTASESTLSSIPSSPTSSVSGTAPPMQSTTKAMLAEAIIGAVIGLFALLSIVFALLVWRRNRRKSKESAPSRAFGGYLDRNDSLISDFACIHATGLPNHWSSLRLDGSCFHKT